MTTSRRDFSFLSEAFGLLLIFILPLKFGTIVTISSISMTYWRDLLPLLISVWPVALFPFFAGVWLILTLLTVPKKKSCSADSLYAAGWLFLALIAIVGTFHDRITVNYGMQMLSYLFGVVCIVCSASLLLDAKPEFKKHAAYAFSVGLVFSMFSGFYQYFYGYRFLLDQLHESYRQNGEMYNENIVARLNEFRVTADFSSCNAYAGYLLLTLPILCGVLWKSAREKSGAFYAMLILLVMILVILAFGSPLALILATAGGLILIVAVKLPPPETARWIMTFLAAGCGGYLLWKTGSRGAFLSLLSAAFLLFLALKGSLKLKLFLCSLVSLGVGALGVIVFLGRGGKSILFRLDYFQGALRMLWNSPWTGSGWGGFQKDFLLLRMIADREAPNSPHNFILSFASQCGVGGLIFSVFVLSFPVVLLLLHLRRKTLREAFAEESGMFLPAALGFLAWSVHALMEISLETAASTALASIVAVLLLRSTGAGCCPETGKGGWRVPALKWILSLAILVLTFGYGVRYLRYDVAFSRLNDLLDASRTRKAENPSEIAAAYRRCEELLPESYYHVMSLLNYYEARNIPPDELIPLLETAIRRYPCNAALYIRLSALLHRTGRPDEAAAARKKARELAPFDHRYQE